jgi:hypothetical protein
MNKVKLFTSKKQFKLNKKFNRNQAHGNKFIKGYEIYYYLINTF